MRCYRHRTDEAIGICRACGKGVCEACSTDTGVGLSCGTECDAPVRGERALLHKATQVYSGGHVFTTVMGSLFAVPSGFFALAHLAAGAVADALVWLPFTALGVLFIGWGRYTRLRRAAIAATPTTARIAEPAPPPDER